MSCEEGKPNLQGSGPGASMMGCGQTLPIGCAGSQYLNITGPILGGDLQGWDPDLCESEVSQDPRDTPTH